MNRLFVVPVFAGFAALVSACASPPRQDSAPQYKSSYEHRSASVGGLRVADRTPAPLRMVLMTRLDIPPAKAFDLVSRDLPAWIKQIPRVDWDHSNSRAAGTYGPGSIRRCSFGDKHLTETIHAWEEGKVYAYTVEFDKSTMSMPIKDHLGVFIVESDGRGGSLVTWRQYFNGRFPGAASMARFMMRRKIMDPAFDELVRKFGGERVRPIL